MRDPPSMRLLLDHRRYTVTPFDGTAVMSSFEAEVDGTRVRKCRATNHSREHTIDGAKVDRTTVRKMYFANVEQCG